MITIDGSFGEGGGQILRTSLALAAITGQSVTIDNIRVKRPKPGLRPQHLTGALAVAEICGAELAGAEVDSTRLTFKPGRIRSGDYEFDVSRARASAGSVNLVLQTILWPLAFGGKDSRVVIRGGTHVPFAPTFNYIDEVFLPAVADMGLRCRYSMIRAGYYPVGRGEVKIEIPAVEKLTPISITEAEKPYNVEVTSAVSNLPTSIADRQLSRASARLKAMGLGFESRVVQYPSPGQGTAVFISLTAAHCPANGTTEGVARAGFQSLGELGKRAEKVADEACDELEAYLESGAALDKHLADQLIAPIALADGLSRFTTCEVTQHLLTNIAVVEQFLPVRFQISAELGQPGTVERVS